MERGAKVGEFVNEDICQLTFPSNHFDLAIHSETLEHVFDFNKALSEVQRVLKPGGVQDLHRAASPQPFYTAAHASDGRGPHTGTFFHPATMAMKESFRWCGNLEVTFSNSARSSISELHYDNYWHNTTVFTVSKESAKTYRHKAREKIPLLG